MTLRATFNLLKHKFEVSVDFGRDDALFEVPQKTYSQILRTNNIYQNLHLEEQLDSDVYKSLLGKVMESGYIGFDVLTQKTKREQSRVSGGYGDVYAWATILGGQLGGYPVLLETTDFGKFERDFQDGFDYAFAWENLHEGKIDQMQLNLAARKVGAASMRIGDYAEGYACTAEFYGEIGDRLAMMMELTDSSRKSTRSIGGYGYGFEVPVSYQTTILLKE